MITKPPYRKQSNEPKTVRDLHGKIVADFQRVEDADFVIAVCNSHSHLLNALQEMMPFARLHGSPAHLAKLEALLAPADDSH